MSPIVVSVPSIIRCLSLSEVIVATDFVGAPDKTVDLVDKAAGTACIGLHVKVLPFFTVAINVSPKLSNDHEAGSIITLDVKDVCPQAV